MQKTTQGTSSPGNEGSAGSQNTKPVKAETIRLRPWEIAEKLLLTANGQISVEFASDAQFDTWVRQQGIPVDDSGIPEWSFDDRCGVIIYALTSGLALQFAEPQAAQEGA